jgi:hypothetical protein
MELKAIVSIVKKIQLSPCTPPEQIAVANGTK